MKILQLEAKSTVGSLNKNEEKELIILKKKEKELDLKIESIK